MLQVDKSQTINQQSFMFGSMPAATGWNPLAKVVLATSVGFASLAAAYLNRQTSQNPFHEQYSFSTQNIAYPLLGIGLIGLGAAGVYLWKRNKVNDIAEKTFISPQEPVGVPSKEIMNKEAEGILANKHIPDLSEGKKIIDGVIDQMRQDHDADGIENPLTAQKINPFIDTVLKNCVPSENLSGSYDTLIETYDSLHKALYEASKLIQSPDTKPYRNEKGEIEVHSILKKDYKARLKAFLDFAKTLTEHTDELSQRLVAKAYNKLLGYSKLQACELAINSIGNPGEGCKTIVQKVFTDLVSAADKMEETYLEKYKNAANPVAFEQQFAPLSDKIMQLAGNFIIACMKTNDVDSKNIIEDAFPVLLKKKSLSALKFAIYCLEHGTEECKMKFEFFDDELSDLLIYEASQCNLKQRGKSLADLIKRNPSTDEKDVLDFGLEDLRDFKIHTVKTLILDSDEISLEEDGPACEGSDSSDEFTRTISQMLTDLNYSSYEEETITSASNIFTMEDI